MKKILILMSIIALALSVTFSFSACNFDKDSDISSSENGNGRDPDSEDGSGDQNDQNDQNDQTPGESHVHSMVKTDRVEATCTADGNVEYYTCTGCKKIYSDLLANNEIEDVIIPKAHTGGFEVRGRKDATENEEGYTGDKYCLGCGAKIEVGEVISKIPHTHSMTKIDRVESTCTENGNIEYYTCDGCKKIYADESGTTEISAESTLIEAGHVFDKHVCSGCGFDRTSHGFEFEKNPDGVSYTLTGIGTCTDTDLYIALYRGAYPITAIGDFAFDGCNNITSITMLDGITSIGQNAFSDCSNLKSITIPSTVTYIGSYAFAGDRAITELNFEASNVANLYSSSNVFGNSGDVESGMNVIIGEKVQRIPNYLFDNTYGKINIKFKSESNCKIIGNGAFRNCKNLSSIVLPDSITEIGANAFSQCINLENVNIPKSATIISDGAFSGCEKITSIIIPESVVTIGSYAFSGLANAKTLIMSEGLKTIGTHVFLSCTSLEEVLIPDSVETIGEAAFWGCSGLKKVSLGKGLNTLGIKAFYGCTAIELIDFYPTALNDLVYKNKTFADCGIEGNGIEVIIRNNVTKIPERLFDPYNQYPKIVKVEFEESSVCESIGYQAFCAAEELSSITLPDSLKTIGSAAFISCKGLQSLVIPDAVTSIASQAFYDCDNISKVTIGKNVASIGSYAFGLCDNIAEVYNRSDLLITAGSADYGCVAEYALKVYTDNEEP